MDAFVGIFATLNFGSTALNFVYRTREQILWGASFDLEKMQSFQETLLYYCYNMIYI